jgi:transcriptional regulator with XRE-family HTH domain
LKQSEVSERLGISRSTYAGYENEGPGHRIPPADIISRLADLYGVTADYILGRTEDDWVKQTHFEEVAEILHSVHNLTTEQQEAFWKHLVSYTKLMEPFFRD